MTFTQGLIAYLTIQRSEGLRVFRVWRQTLVPPTITSILYFVIFGHVIGQRVGSVHDVKYVAFIAPGLIMMQMITSAYSASVFCFYFAKFQKSIEEILVTPMSNMLILVSFMSVGMLRGLVVGLIVAIIAMIFAGIHLHSIFMLLFVSVISTAIFSLFGLINGVYAKSFDDIATVPNFVITPLTYFGGVFYAVSMLPVVFRKLSYINPIYYVVTAFRYGFLGIDHHLMVTCVLVLLIMFVVAFIGALLIFRRGAGLRP